MAVSIKISHLVAFDKANGVKVWCWHGSKHGLELLEKTGMVLFERQLGHIYLANGCFNASCMYRTVCLYK